MAKSSTSFGPGNRANPSGRPPLTPEQRKARDLRASMQPQVVKELLRIGLEAEEDKDRIAALKALLEELPLEVADVTERETTRPVEELLAIGIGALLARRGETT